MLDQNGTIRDLSNIVEDIAGDVLQPESLEKLKNLDPGSLLTIEGSPRMGACVSGIGKFICIGLNYSDHAEETGAKVPPEPIIFSKATSAVSGPNDDIIIPRNSVKTDWEVELGVVIGKPAKYVEESSALDHVAGYCVINDVSEREFQSERQGQWVKGKSCDPSVLSAPGWSPLMRQETLKTSNSGLLSMGSVTRMAAPKPWSTVLRFSSIT